MGGSHYFSRPKGVSVVFHFNYAQIEGFRLKRDLLKLDVNSFLFLFQITLHHQMYQGARPHITQMSGVQRRMEIQSS